MTCEGYTLLQRLGSGGFAEVWLAEDTSRQRVALKFLPIRKDQKFHADLFKQEFSLLSELRHAHLARVFDFGISPRGDYYYFTEEICPGEDLLKATREKPIQFFEICLVQLLSALDYIHSMGIIHFDIKSENIIVEERGTIPRVKLLDFGIAARLKNLPEFIGGTLNYMAPELIQQRKLDHRVDLYSLGMLCLRALTGRLPFSPDNPKTVMRWHIEGGIPESIWEDRSPPKHLREITEKLLQKKPDDRFSSARVAINFLNQTTGHRYRQEEQALQPQIPPEGPLVGRENLLTSLKKRGENALLSKTPSAISSVCLLSGEQGIGKSRMVSEIRQWMELKETRFFYATGDRLVSMWGDFCRWLGRTDPAADEPDEMARAKKRVDFVLEAVRKKPFGLLIDDLHKSDDEMKLFFSQLAEKTRLRRAAHQAVPFFALVTTEEKEASAIPLDRLRPEEVFQYCERVLGKVDRLGPLSQILFSYSGGLPLLMVEGLRFIAPHFLKGEPLDVLPPAGLESLYERKIEDLSAEERELLFILALLYRPIRLGDLAHIMARPVEDLPKVAARAQRAGLLLLAYESLTYQLSSQALALNLIRQLDPAKRAGLHLKIAAGLEGLEGTPPAELGYHWAKGNEKEKGRRYLKLAAAHLKEEGQLSNAAKYLHDAISLLQKGSQEWIEMIEEVTRLMIATGDFGGAESSLCELEGAAPSNQRFSELKGLLAFKKRDWETARREYEKALGALPPDDLFSKTSVENALANIDLQSGRWSEAARRFQDTLQLEERLPPEVQKKISGNNLGLALARLGRFDEAIRFYEKRLMERGHDPREEVAIGNALGYVLLQASRFAEAIRCLENVRKSVQDHGNLHILFSALGNLVTAYFKESRYVESLQISKEMVSWQERFGSERDIAYNLLRQGDTYLILGMEEAAHDCFERGLSHIGDSDPVLVCWFRLMEAYREREFGDSEKAKDLLKEILKEEGLADTSHLAWARLALADILHDEGKDEEAQEYLRQIPGNFQDEEFAVRRDLLTAKISGEPESFPPLEGRCLQNHFLELLWEVYHAWGRSLRGSGNRTEAVVMMEKGATILRRISDALPEEYRDRYLHFKEREALFRDLAS